jgi:glucose-6-phosphate isomerase
MDPLLFDYSKSFIEKHEIDYFKEPIAHIHTLLHHKKCQGNDSLGWLGYPMHYDKNELDSIKAVADQIKRDSQVFLVIGIGGSYLGARAAIDMLGHSFYNLLPPSKRKTPEIYFIGNNLSSTYYKHLMDVIEGKDLSICVISKSGTTTEPAIAFRLIRAYMEKRYGEKEANQRIYIITDAQKGALRQLANEKKHQTFAIPEDIGGRYSVLTPVGLLPMAVSGIDISQIMMGAEDGHKEYGIQELSQNPCYQYAVLRNLLYRKGKAIEVLVSYEPFMDTFTEWWKQLFGESEGKDQKGIFPSSVAFTTDLHSMGQFLQDGTKNLFETVLQIQKSKEKVTIQEDKDNIDALNFVAGKTMEEINQRAFQGTLLAHADGKVPNLILTIPEITPYYFGKLVYFFEKACAVSGIILGVNPFDQPGVERYKKNMYALLGKPGYETLRKTLIQKLSCKDGE